MRRWCSSNFPVSPSNTAREKLAMNWKGKNRHADCLAVILMPGIFISVNKCCCRNALVFLDGGLSSWLPSGGWLDLVGWQDGSSTSNGFIVIKSSYPDSSSSGDSHWSSNSSLAFTTAPFELELAVWSLFECWCWFLFFACSLKILVTWSTAVLAHRF